ncbi:carboxypeptidase-like regulatory domain-containing protein [Cytophagaceae bacterium ABcell3]|nr:carboxypeptidase-like regulatory domain-containing protein [Cytophagaceae bacterium ABcell3]
MKNHYTVFLKRAGILLAFLMGTHLSYAQTGMLKGIVTDKETGEPLIDVNVSIPKLNKGTLTELGGDYILQGIPAGKHTPFTFWF